MSRTGQTTPNGIQKWVNTDKPQLDDFNGVINEVDTALSNKAEKRSPTLNTFAFASGWSQINDICRYWKNQENEVTLMLYAERSSDIVVNELICTVPVGFRISNSTNLNAEAQSITASQLGFIHLSVSSNGEIRTRGTVLANARRILLHLSYIASA